MVITYTAILSLMLFLIRPLQKNVFFILYFGLIIGAAQLTEMYFFRTTPFAYKTFILFIPYHLIFINLVTFIAYGVDKKAAIQGHWRIPEMNLHTLEFLGGWPAAYIAQKFFRHKTKKKSYQTMFWLVLLFQVVTVYYILSFLNIIH